MHRSVAVALTAALAILAGCHRPRANAVLSWRGDVPAGHWLRVRNISGPIAVEPSSDGKVEIDARPVGGGSVRRIRYAQNRVGDDLIVCTMYGAGGSCTPKRYHTSSPRRWWWPFERSASVAYTIRVPAGVKLDLSDVAGSVKVAGASGDVVARSVNGEVAVASAAGPVRAETVNGSVIVRIDSTSDVHVETVNGGIHLTLPATLAASVSLETVNGAINSDFPLTSEGKYGPKHASGTIGGGGAHSVKAETVNGSVTVQKAS